MTDSWKTIERNQNEIDLEKGYLDFCFNGVIDMVEQ